MHCQHIPIPVFDERLLEDDRSLVVVPEYRCILCGDVLHEMEDEALTANLALVGQD